MHPRIIRRNQKILVSQDQCDCACSGTVPMQSAKVNYLPDTLFHCHPDTQYLPLNDDYEAMFIPSKTEIVVVNQTAAQIFKHFKTARVLNDTSLQWSEQWGSKSDEILQDFVDIQFLTAGQNFTPSPASDRLVAWLHVTNECNLRCSYCYLKKTDEAMSEEVGQQAIEAIFRSALANNYTQVKLKFAGGESTLNLKLVIQMQKQAQALAKFHNLELTSVILSNGVALSQRSLQAIIQHNMELMISLDGLGEAHNSQRVFANGSGSFISVARTIERAMKVGLKPYISITVSDRNIDSLPETVAQILAWELPFSINFYRENPYSVSFKDLHLQDEKLIQGMKKTFQTIEANLPRWSLLGVLADLANLGASHQYTCGVGHDYLVIDHRGLISKCQMQIEQTVTNIYADDPLALIRADQIGIQNVKVDEKEDCRDCKWQYWCTGGCPLATYRATGHYDVKSPNCDIYKALYPEVIRLEGLRLLKWEASTGL